MVRFWLTDPKSSYEKQNKTKKRNMLSYPYLSLCASAMSSLNSASPSSASPSLASPSPPPSCAWRRLSPISISTRPPSFDLTSFFLSHPHPHLFPTAPSVPLFALPFPSLPCPHNHQQPNATTRTQHRLSWYVSHDNIISFVCSP